MKTIPSNPGPHLRSLFLLTLLCLTLLPLTAQTPPPTGPQTLTLSALRAGPNPLNPQSQINAIAISPQGNLYILIDQKDGIRLFETDPTATSILAQTQLGAAGDTGLALTLDPTGNIYITGTSTSGTLSATSGAAFPTPTGTATNGFAAKFDPTLHPIFLTFTGASPMAAQSIAATADAVFLTGLIFTPNLPVTPTALLQSPAPSTPQNGFVEKFSSDGTHLLYATYLTAANGTTSPTAIAADTADNAYIASSTSSSAYPTTPNALIPQILNPTSGFLTKLTPQGDALAFSTYIPGSGVTSLTLDPAANNLLLSGNISPGQFPIANVTQPLTPLPYQSLLSISLDGSTVLSSTLLAPGTQSFITQAPSNTAWVAGDLTLPLLPLTPLSEIGTTFAAHINSAGLIDQTTRLGGIPTSNPNFAASPILLTSLATDTTGNPTFAGAFQPTASQSLLSTQTFDLPVTNPTPAFPDTAHSAVLPASSCSGSLCPGSASYLAQLTTTASPQASLALSPDDSPNLTLRNLGSTPAINLQLTTTGFTNTTNCPTTLPAGSQCSIALTGSGPGTITLTATNAATQTQTLPATTTSPLPIVFSPKELDFGIVTSANPAPTPRTLTVTNLTQNPHTFLSKFDISPFTTPPYTLTEIASDCTPAGVHLKLLPAGATCHIALGLTASASPSDDAPIHPNWLIGTRDVQLTAYTQAAALSLSAPQIDFGINYPTTPQLPRYLYLSNASTTNIPHTPITLPPTSPFTLTDNCPTLLLPFTVCQLKLTYLSPHTPSTDTTTLTLDQGLTALITGATLPTPAPTGPSPLTLAPTTITFTNPVLVTSTSATPQTLTLTNPGSTSIPIVLTLTGDFSKTSTCTSSISANSSCTIDFTFAPSQPGTRNGLLTITTPSATYTAALTGTATPILAPANNGTLDFGPIFIGQPSVQWIKVTQPFPAFSATATSPTPGTPYLATLVEDTGSGHGQPPPSAFSTHPTGTCFNCWLGIRFTPPASGLETGTLTLTSTGSPYVLSLTGTGLPVTGLIITPTTQDFGPIPIHSTSPSTLFTVTNLNPAATPITLAPPTLTGDFILTTPTSGPACGAILAYTASCTLAVAFTSSTLGPAVGTLTLQATTTSGTLTAAAQLTGNATSNPGLTLNPTALIFNNVSGPSATQQTILVTNSTNAPEQIALSIPNSPAFTATSTCNTLAPSATCTVTVTFTPTTSTQSSTLSVSANSSGNIISYTISLSGAYTTQTASLQILPNNTQFVPQSLSTLSPTRQFTLNNLSAKSLAVILTFPRQFALTTSTCATLAPFATCTFSAAYVPLTTADTTGTLVATAIPTDNSPNLTGLAYLAGYGTNITATTLSLTGPSLANGTLDFGQLPSNQTTQRTLTLTNSSTLPITIHRITTPWPFLATSNCLAPLTPTQTCTITLTYAPLNQVPLGSAPAPATPDASTLLIESDAATSPTIIPLTGSSTPIPTASPSNTPTQPILTPSQNSLTFAKTAPGTTSSPQTIVLTNTGTTPLTLTIPPTAEFPATTTCTTLAPSATCTLTISFTPQSLTSTTHIAAIELASNASTPLEFISLLGFTDPAPHPTFTLTANGAPTAASTVTAGSSATYALTATPVNGFTGPIALTCTPIQPAPSATCTIQPPSLTLASSPQTATATITTTAATTAQLTPHSFPGAGTIATCLLLPTFLFAFKKSRRPTTACAILTSLTLLTLSACGNTITPYLRPSATQPATPAGTYIYQVTAASTTAPTTITQAVTLTLTVR